MKRAIFQSISAVVIVGSVMFSLGFTINDSTIRVDELTIGAQIAPGGLLISGHLSPSPPAWQKVAVSIVSENKIVHSGYAEMVDKNNYMYIWTQVDQSKDYIVIVHYRDYSRSISSEFIP